MCCTLVHNWGKRKPEKVYFIAFRQAFSPNLELDCWPASREILLAQTSTVTDLQVERIHAFLGRLWGYVGSEDLNSGPQIYTASALTPWAVSFFSKTLWRFCLPFHLGVQRKMPLQAMIFFIDIFFFWGWVTFQSFSFITYSFGKQPCQNNPSRGKIS